MNRRGFIGGLLALVAAPVVIRSGILMPLRGVIMRPFATSVIYGPDDVVLSTNAIYSAATPDDVMWVSSGELPPEAMREVVTFTKPFGTLRSLNRSALPVGITSAWSAEQMTAAPIALSPREQQYLTERYGHA